MGAVIGDLLPLGIGVAVSPIPIVAAILMILSRNASGAGKGFLAGWVIGVVVATALICVIAGAVGITDGREPSATGSWIKVVLGIGLVVLAANQWHERTDTTPPDWMNALDRLTTVRAAGLGVLLSAVNPKNLLLCVSAGVAIGSSTISAGGKITALIVFTVLASASVASVVLGYAIAADRVRPGLDSARKWLQDNNHAVMAIVLLVMGAVVLGKGIGGL
ncbi:GAP family protein [Nocardia sp. NPDC052001]|uniref:GAP family protein n=1 Tax=Nocardia sp. NPDC052001 TaxID=3154853 RepID=UPI003439AC4C